MIDFRVRYEGLARRETRDRMLIDLLRGSWIGASVALAAAVGGLLRPSPAPGGLAVIALGVAVFVGAILLVRRARRVDLIHDLERRHGLGDLLVTALEVDGRGAATGLDVRLLSDAAATLSRLSTDRSSLGAAARLEAETLFGVVCVLLGVLLLGTVRDPLADVDRLPPLEVGSAASGWGASGSSGAASGGRTSHTSAGPGDLAGMAPELADHAASRAMAEALSRGDLGEAAREARALAGSVAAMSGIGRQQLATTLSEAAAALGDAEGTIGEALDEAGEALAGDSDEAAAAALSQLASAFDRHSSGAAAPSGAARMPETRSRAAAAPTARTTLEAPGPGRVPLPARSAADPSIGAGRSDLAVTAGGTAGGSAAGPADARSPSGSGGPDPLRVPWEWRRTVQRYFARAVGQP